MCIFLGSLRCHCGSECETIHSIIGTCRAVWVPGQDLAMLHLMCNCGKRICHYTVHYMYVSAHICCMLVTMCLCVWSSWYEYAWFKITWVVPRSARACRRLCIVHHYMIHYCRTCSLFCNSLWKQLMLLYPRPHPPLIYQAAPHTVSPGETCAHTHTHFCWQASSAWFLE